MIKKHLRDILDSTYPGLLGKGSAIRRKMNKLNSVKHSSVEALAKALAANPDALASLLMTGLPALSSASDSAYVLLAQHFELVVPTDPTDPTVRAREAIGELMWPIYWRCAETGEGISSGQDAKLALTLAQDLLAGADPCALMLLREGLEAPMLSACLLVQAWASAKVLLSAGADANRASSGDIPGIPPLYFAVRHRDSEAGLMASHMIKKGADPWAVAVKTFSFDDSRFPEPVQTRRGELFKWMIFFKHAEPLHSALVGTGAVKNWPQFLGETLEEMGWHPSEAGDLTAAIEHLEFSDIALPSDEQPLSFSPKKRTNRI